MKSKFLYFGKILALLLMSAVLTQEALAQTDETDTISGIVTPAEAGITVQALRNLSIVAETVTDENGSYVLSGLSNGTYGLLFTRRGAVFVYNDEAYNGTDPDESFITKLRDNIMPDASDVNIDLNAERPDYIDKGLIVHFNQDLSPLVLIDVQDNRNRKIITLHNYTIKSSLDSTWPGLHRFEWKQGGMSYVLDIPEGKTVLEVGKEFNLEEDVKYAEEGRVAWPVGQEYENLTQDIDTYNSTVIVVPTVIEGFRNQTLVRVIVTLKEHPNHREYTSEERRADPDRINQETKALGEEMLEKVLPTLSDSDFNLTHKFESLYSFSGAITEGGLSKLRNNPYVRHIVVVEVYSGALASGEGGGPSNKTIVTKETLEFVCGNGICEAEETCENCAFDCICGNFEECVDAKCKPVGEDEAGPDATKTELSWLGRLIQFVKTILGLN